MHTVKDGTSRGRGLTFFVSAMRTERDCRSEGADIPDVSSFEVVELGLERYVEPSHEPSDDMSVMARLKLVFWCCLVFFGGACRLRS